MLRSGRLSKITMLKKLLRQERALIVGGTTAALVYLLLTYRSADLLGGAWVDRAVPVGFLRGVVMRIRQNLRHPHSVNRP